MLRALEEGGIHPTVVAGCSIGAVVGACYAAGRLDRLEAFARALTRRRVVGLIDPRLRLMVHIADGSIVAPGDVIASIEGPARGILMGMSPTLLRNAADDVD